jgi:hypothetical protein
MSRYFHRTTRETAEAILRGGFKDRTDYYLTSSLHTGVWLSAVPLDGNEGAEGDTSLAVDVPAEVVERYEWIEDGKPYREFLVPAAALNPAAKVALIIDD